jgi:DNA helicase II / ATP-dependent DNA helicase PcrA
LEFLADFHVHSRYSRATSRDLTLENLHKAALEKGVTVAGTGDFTHPAWMEEIRESLVQAEDGLFRLRPDLCRDAAAGVPSSCNGEVRFLLTAEISSIYKRDGQVRKVHNLIFVPTLDTAWRITGRLEKIGNIASDGRPILGLDSRDLLEIVAEASPDAFLVPAHIWTPWFSVLGSKSGFDSLEECFGDLTEEIFCVETGLSSDPGMNWRVSALDRYTLISNSDTHSPRKLGREANRLDCELSYAGIRAALRNGRPAGFLGTVEFFPEQGKYHLDGHRKCGCCLHPAETLERNELCPVCGRKVTVGVMHRVEKLADRPEGAKPACALPYERLISLAELVGEVKGAGPETKGVVKICRNLVQRLGPELQILSRVPLEDVRREGGELLAEGLRRMRAAEVLLEAGYDGEFGVVRLFREEEREELGGQAALSGFVGEEKPGKKDSGQGARKKGAKGKAGASGKSAGSSGEPEPGGPGGASGGDAAGEVGRLEAEDGVLCRMGSAGAMEPGGCLRRPPRDASGSGGPAGAQTGESEAPLFSEPASSGRANLMATRDHDTSGSGNAAGMRTAESEAPLFSEPASLGDSDLRGAGDGPGGILQKDSSGREPALLQGLNPEQREAVLFQGAPLLIVAGPGTGKTHTLTRRIAWMVRVHEVPAGRVLAVTFTQRAAREMEERLVSLLGKTARDSAVQVRTFHALGAELLRQAGAECGIHPGFRILDSDDSLRLFRSAVPGLKRKEADPLLQRIALAKKDLRYPEDGDGCFPDRGFLSVFQKYEEALDAYRALDYEDLVSRTVRILDRFPGFLEKVQARFQAVSVDEYQDVNHAQVRLLKHLCSAAHDLCAIGDPHQAIYGFRGASPSYFLDFERDFPNGRVVRLQRNYRSTETILSASVRMISPGLPDGSGPRLVPQEPGGVRIREVELSTEKSEAIFIAQTIESLVGGTDSLSFYADKVADSGESLCSGFGDIAVLYRLNALGPGLENALRYQGIPCQGAAQADRWKGREGRALVGLMQWMRDPADRLARERVREAVHAPAEKMLQDVERYRHERTGMRASLAEWVMGLPELEWLPFREPGWKEPWDVLVRAAVAHRGDWDGFIRSLVLSREPDFLDRKAEKVTLASLHAAKGLEFPVVFVAGCENGLIPWSQGNPPPDPQEERRLFFVGMTRACRVLYLTRTRSRFLFGERTACRPSPFLGDIPQDHLERIRGSGEGKKPGPRGPEQPLLFKLD